MFEQEDEKNKKKREEPLEQEEFDLDEEGFGGLPDRDLKKNLGCG